MQATRLDLKRTRGDTSREVFKFTLTDIDDAVVDLTGYTFVLTVDTLQSPLDDATNVVSIAGAILDAAEGTVEFDGAWDTVDAGSLFYEVQMTTPTSKISTITRGRLTVTQDIVKA